MNPDLQHKLGRRGKGPRRWAIDHYKDYGFDEGRSVALPAWDKIYSCGDTSDPLETSACKCGGMFYMGRRTAKDSGKELTTLDEMREWAVAAKRTNKANWSECSLKTFSRQEKKDAFGDLKEPIADDDFQCFCERKPKNVPSKCAEYGGDCLCNGLVFQMVKDGAHGENNFYEAFSDDYTANNVNGTKSI